MFALFCLAWYFLLIIDYCFEQRRSVCWYEWMVRILGITSSTYFINCLLYISKYGFDLYVWIQWSEFTIRKNCEKYFHYQLWNVLAIDYVIACILNVYSHRLIPQGGALSLLFMPFVFFIIFIKIKVNVHKIF